MQVQDQLVELLVQTMRDMRRHYDNAARENGLTLARARVISAVRRDEGASQAQIAHALEIEGPTLKKLVDALEERGFIERRDDPTDGRRKTLYLTASGRDTRVADLGRRLRSDMVEGIAAEDLKTTCEVLRRMGDNMNRPAQP
ncbi:MAG: MarR family transcriptional regulator [Paracoccus denitrificans]|nr:MAG: MarR family transcriptional regulator [Paracoccus denitrificans]PZO83049.1 MAG: MarR family transcriptional regulator [Paracoccus denitrificans]